MLAAEETQRIDSDLWFWQRYQPSIKTDCASSALRIGEQLIFVDPIPLQAEALTALTELATPAAIIATNGNHDRAIADLRRKLSIPVFAHPHAVASLGLPVDRLIEDGELLFETLTVVTLPGAGPGEIALHDARGRLLVGDALINLEPLGFSLLPEKYCEDPAEMRRSLQKLLRFPFEVLTFAHGSPLVSRARLRLEAILA